MIQRENDSGICGQMYYFFSTKWHFVGCKRHTKSSYFFRWSSGSVFILWIVSWL